ncbi:TolC family protein [Pinibacter aurantiacus]|uniref:TolC family protein n=1 Tax=Pinibacter aurantiacus TaxID=2851599 RepID=A0A9E2W7Y2_9BACT|nr:TolC family protein [Pinibacter aurantiacus]MBV4357451.1 TolC family protein [Pinibacter aurantiacus]
MHADNFHFKYLVYTLLLFIALCSISYVASAQQPGVQRLSIKDAVSMAVQHNREIKISSLDISKAQEGSKIARSKYLPVVGVTAQVSHYFSQPIFFGLGNNGTDDKIPYSRFGGKDQALGAFNIVQPLYDPSAKSANTQAKLLEEESRLSLSDKQTAVAAYARQTYLLIVVLGERIKLQKESLSRNEKALQDARSLLAQGRALRVDTLRAYTSVKNLEPDLLKLSNAIDVNKQQLKTLLGLDSLQTIELTDSIALPLAEKTVPSEEDVYNQAKEKRADLKAVALQQQISDQQIQSAKADKRPNVALVGQYMIQTQTNQFNYANAYYPSTTFVGAQVNVPIFSGFSKDAKIQQAKIDKQQAVLQTENVYEQLRVDVKQVVSALNETSARMQTRINVKETAQLSYDITQYRYAKGVASRLELTDAELALTGAQLNYLEAVYDYLTAQISLYRVTGRVEN